MSSSVTNPGHALTRGAFTIINGIACGKGGACGVGLRFVARVEYTDQPGLVEFHAGGPGANPDMDDRLVRACVARLLDRVDGGDAMGARVETVSQIPSSRGLKSSSAAANAIILAGLDAMGHAMEPIDVVQMGVDCALDAGVTLTGAFDDAVSTMFGGAVLTDNEDRNIIEWLEVPSGLEVLFLVPERRIAKSTINRSDFDPIHDEVQHAFELALSGQIAEAINLNGRAYAPIMGVDTTPADAALAAGAWAAGMTGTGPAITVLVAADELEAVLAALAPFNTEIIRTDISSTPGQVLSDREYATSRSEITGGDANAQD
jgi:shikimate kinase